MWLVVLFNDYNILCYLMILFFSAIYKTQSQFERMVLDPGMREMNGSEESMEDEDQSWIHEEVDEDNSSKSNDPFFMSSECKANTSGEELCAHLAECRDYLIVARKDLYREIKWRRSKSILWTIFGLGIALGLVLGGTFVCISYMFTDQRINFNTRVIRCQRPHIDYENPFIISDNTDSNVTNEQNITPIARTHQPSQQQPHGRPRQNPPFFTRLFRRQRVYPPRPSLIRRLSRSNLFSSTFRLNQSNARALERQNSRRNNRANCDERHLIDNRDSVPLNQGDRVGDASLESPRCETPPPKYGDVVYKDY